MIDESLLDTVKRAIHTAACSHFPDLLSHDIEVARAKDPQFGDYQCNSAMKLAKRYSIAPQEWAKKIAEEVQQHREKDIPLFLSVEVKGPGFINMRIHPEFLAQGIQKTLQTNSSTIRTVPPHERKKIVVDFSSPNIAKEMHVGHLRSTIIGDSLARVFEARGHDVLRLNHVGDWGTAFGMLIEHLRSTIGDENIHNIASLSLQDLMRLYKESKVRFDIDPQFKARAQRSVVSLQSGEPLHRKIWQMICSTSRQAYQEIYDLLQVHLQERGESFYNDMLGETVQEYEEKGLVTLSEGARCVFLEGFSSRDGTPLPLIIQKSDGGYNYDTTDLAALSHRIREEKADRIIIVTDSGQATHFQMVFAAAEKAGILDRSKVRVDHVPFGLVLGADGKKFKTRSGETEKLIDLLTAAIDQAEAILVEKNPEWTQEERHSLARILGIGAVKYADLACHRVSDYVFSYERMLRFEGNTAAFIMYSYVRTRGILRRVMKSDYEAPRPYHLEKLEHLSEIALAKTLFQFDEVIQEVEESLLPNRLTEYLYSLAEHFNAFFRDCRVEGDPRESDRLALVKATGDVMKEGLMLLGISVPERM